jgi:hypothetical protein
MNLIPLLRVHRHNSQAPLLVSTGAVRRVSAAAARKCRETLLAAQTLDPAQQELQLPVRTRRLVLGNHVYFNR